MFTAAGKSAAVSAANYIEDVFSTYLYTGNGSTQTITNGIDLSGKGGLVWLKKRSSATGGSHRLMDTVRGGNKLLSSNTAGAESTSNQVTFLSSGFDVIDAVDNGATYVSWTFREQAKFFDVVTYTGNGAASRNINHSLGSTPGCIICKRTDSAEDWGVYHRSTGANGLYLNATNSAGVTLVPTGHTSTTFEVASGYGLNNVNGATYVAYLFAHDAGGFGATGSDNVISCGSLTTDASGISTVNLGYEPQWVLLKGASGTNATTQWIMFDTMRGWTNPANNARLFANLSNAETTGDSQAYPTATGFGSAGLAASTTYIYIAIRRGPMRPPTSGTSVFSPTIVASIGATSAAGPSPTDLSILKPALATVNSWRVVDRLRGNDLILSTDTTSAESTETYYKFDTQSGLRLTSWPVASSIFYNLKRAPGFFDVVCYTGTSSAATFNHNLTAVPELMIVKRRDSAGGWIVYFSGWSDGRRLVIQSDSALISADSNIWNNTEPTSTQFTVGSSLSTGSATYINYLFASCPGVSKVGSYTGTGALQTINCGFAAGARFVLIKRTDSTGDWWVYDSARGITSGNDPYLFLNSTAAEVTTTNYVDTDSTGFKVTAAAPAGLNANGGTYIFLAIA